MSETILLAQEPYLCLQGEARLAGTPSILVRCTSCNLRCAWSSPTSGVHICDTEFSSYTPVTIKKSVLPLVTSVVDMAVSQNVGHVIVSGGEPLIQAPAVERLILTLLSYGLHVTIETNGTLPLSAEFSRAVDKYTNVLLSISPKLKTSIPSMPEAKAGAGWAKRHDDRRINYDVLRTLTNLYDSYLKFVVRQDSDEPEIRNLESKLKLQKSHVWLMPEGRTQVEMNETRKLVYEMCLRNSWRYSGRHHVDVYGHVQGV